MNGNVGFDDSVSISYKVATNKEAACPEYQTRDSGSGNGFSSGVSDMVFQQRTMEAVAAREKGKWWELAQK